MQAGLSALRTPQSYAANSSKEDPLSIDVRGLKISFSAEHPAMYFVLAYQVSLPSAVQQADMLICPYVCISAEIPEAG